MILPHADLIRGAVEDSGDESVGGGVFVKDAVSNHGLQIIGILNWVVVVGTLIVTVILFGIIDKPDAVVTGSEVFNGFLGSETAETIFCKPEIGSAPTGFAIGNQTAVIIVIIGIGCHHGSQSGTTSLASEGIPGRSPLLVKAI